MYQLSPNLETLANQVTLIQEESLCTKVRVSTEEYGFVVKDNMNLHTSG